MFFSRPAGHKYIDRGSSEANDFETGDFTCDGAWHDLDLSGIIPKGAALCRLQLYMACTAAAVIIKVKRKGYVGDFNGCVLRMNVANQGLYADKSVAPDSDGVIEYLATAAGISNIALNVQGWFI